MFLISYLFTVIIASELAFLVGKENVFSLADHHCHGFKRSERERRVKWKLRLGELIKLIAVLEENSVCDLPSRLVCSPVE